VVVMGSAGFALMPPDGWGGVTVTLPVNPLMRLMLTVTRAFVPTCPVTLGWSKLRAKSGAGGAPMPDSLAMNPSWLPLLVSTGPTTTGKLGSVEAVDPQIYTFPLGSNAMPKPTSSAEPPKYAAYKRPVPSTLTFATKASPKLVPPLKIEPSVTGRSGDRV